MILSGFGLGWRALEAWYAPLERGIAFVLHLLCHSLDD